MNKETYECQRLRKMNFYENVFLFSVDVFNQIIMKTFQEISANFHIITIIE